MQAIIEVLFPIFGFIIIGYVVRRLRLIGEAGIRRIILFVLYFAVPALLFRVVVQNELPGLDDLNIVLTYYSACLLVFVAASLFGRAVFSLPLDQRAILGMGSMYSNTILMGMPIVFSMFGEPGIIPILLIVTFHNVLLFPLVIVSVEIGRGRREAVGASGMVALRSAFRGTIENPIIIALGISFLWAATGLGMPEALNTFTGYVGKVVAPTALFAVGASMAGYKIAGALSESLTIVAFKLLVHPAVVWLLGKYVFNLDSLYLAVATITAAVPVGANVFILSQKYKVYRARVTSAVVLSAALSVVTLGVVLAYFAPS